MAETEYSRLRAKAIELNRRKLLGHPCAMGVGDCCEASAPVYKEDIVLVKQAVADSQIDRETVLRARRKAVLNRLGQRFMCPFLDDTSGKCEIYAFRPMICIATGSLGYAKKKKIDQWKRAGADKVPCAEVNMGLCPTCTDQLEHGKYFVPISHVLLADEVVTFSSAGGRDRVTVVDLAEKI